MEEDDVDDEGATMTTEVALASTPELDEGLSGDMSIVRGLGCDFANEHAYSESGHLTIEHGTITHIRPVGSLTD